VCVYARNSSGPVGTIRDDYAVDVGSNNCHGSDAMENRKIGQLFGPYFVKTFFRLIEFVRNTLFLNSNERMNTFAQ
jgi:hypothetical protein